MKAAEIILEYIKVLAWPLIIALGFIFYSQDLLNILKSREIEAFGLKIGSQVEELNSNYKAEITALKEQLQSSESCIDNSAFIEKLDSIEGNLDKSLSQMKTTALSESSPVASKADLAKTAETRGFEAILRRDIDAARIAFEESSEIWPEYHNTTEISRLLNESKFTNLAPTDLEGWEDIIEPLLEKYSWGMTPDVRARLMELKEQ
jgi:hypothetical protein